MADAGKTNQDILHLHQKHEASQLSVQNVGQITIFTVENSNLYPKQANGIRQKMMLKANNIEKPKILVDLSKVQLVTSAFIGGLVELHNHVASKSGVVKLFVPNKHVSYTLRLVRLHKLMEISADRYALLAQF